MEKREEGKRAVVVVSTDKGLCGALNSNLMREAANSTGRPPFISLPAAKHPSFIARTKRQLAAEFTYKDAPLFGEARAISKFAQDLFLKGEVTQVMSCSRTSFHAEPASGSLPVPPGGRTQSREPPACMGTRWERNY